MSEKPTNADQAIRANIHPSDPVYGNRWGRGATPTEHNGAGTVARDPASAPRPHARKEGAPSDARPAEISPQEDAMRAGREERWETDGGAGSKPARG